MYDVNALDTAVHLLRVLEIFDAAGILGYSNMTGEVQLYRTAFDAFFPDAETDERGYKVATYKGVHFYAL